MNKGPSKPLPSDWAKGRLEEIRRQIEAGANSSELADKLLKHLANSDAAANLQEGDEDMLAYMVGEAFRGVDIEARYPEFFKKLLGNLELRQAFLNALELLEKESANASEAPSEAIKPKLDFLHAQSPVSIQARSGGHRIEWQRGVDALRALFTPQELVFRRGDQGLMEETWFTLLRDEVEVEHNEYAVVLEGTFSAESANALEIHLQVAVTNLNTKAEESRPIQASLSWGAYAASIGVPEEGRADFPSIPLADILDSESQDVAAELRLLLDVTSL